MHAARPIERPRKRQRVQASRFLDLEATVEQESDTDDAQLESEDEEFLDDETEEDTREYRGHVSLLRQVLLERDRRQGAGENTAASSTQDERQSECAEGDVVDEIYARIRQRQSRPFADEPLAFSSALDADDNDPSTCLPTATDMLYEIPCAIGHEEAAVVSIFYLTSPPRTSGQFQDRPSWLRAAFFNPFIPGRIYLEVDQFSRAQDVARRVHHLRPVDILEIDHVDRLSPLLLKPPPNIQHGTWVRFVHPTKLRGRVGLVIRDKCYRAEEVMLVPKELKGCNADGLWCNPDGLKPDSRTTAYPLHPTDQDIFSSDTVERFLRDKPNDAPILFYEPRRSCSKTYCDAGFRYLPLSSCKLETGCLPPADELLIFHRMRKISTTDYNVTLHRIEAAGLQLGEFVLITQLEYAGLVGVVKQTDAGTCTLHIPSHDMDIEIDSSDVRRHFRVGDRVESMDGRLGLEGIPMWIVSLTDDGTFQCVLLDIRTMTEHITSILLLRFIDDPVVALSAPCPKVASSVWPAKVFCVRFSKLMSGVHNGWRTTVPMLIGRITNIASYSADVGTIEFTPDLGVSCGVSTLPLTNGMEASLTDDEGLGGTAIISKVTHNSIFFSNLSAGLSLPHSGMKTSGPYDHHVKKWVVVLGGLNKGIPGLIKSVTLDGRATVELQIQPMRSAMVHVSDLALLKCNEMYRSRLGRRLEPTQRESQPIPETLPFAARAPPTPPRPVTPPPEPGDANDFESAAERDCSWLKHPEVQGIPVKLAPLIGLATGSPAYRFLRLFDQTNQDGSQTVMASVMIRSNERSRELSKLRWIKCTGSGQMVMPVAGANCGQIYWTTSQYGDRVLCRLEPKVAGAASELFPMDMLAQVFKNK